MVPLRGDRLREAVALAGLSERQLAARLGTDRQRLNYLLQQEGRTRCRHSLRASLAQHLSVPAAYLGGEIDFLPWVAFQGGPTLTAANLAVYRFMQPLADLFARAYRAEHGGADPGEDDVRILWENLRLLVDPEFWRDVFMAGGPRAAWTPDDWNATQTALADAFGRILRTGRQELDLATALDRLIPVVQARRGAST